MEQQNDDGEIETPRNSGAATGAEGEIPAEIHETCTYSRQFGGFLVRGPRSFAKTCTDFNASRRVKIFRAFSLGRIFYVSERRRRGNAVRFLALSLSPSSSCSPPSPPPPPPRSLSSGRSSGGAPIRPSRPAPLPPPTPPPTTTTPPTHENENEL